MSNITLYLLLFFNFAAHAQMIAPCGSDYGSASDESNIAYQMRYGTISDAINAINQAKNTRGTALGCPQTAYGYDAPNTSKPLLSDVSDVWNSVHAPVISAFSVTCPRIGRYENNSALGAYYAMQAGFFKDTIKLSEIADMMYDQQYANWNIASPNPRNEGVYAYINTLETDPCYPGGVVGSSVNAICSNLPAYCVQFTGGQFSGNKFVTSGQDDANNWFDGGLAYDHGWVGVQMIESALMQNEPALKQKYRNSVELAGQYAISEHCVKNHNYTAKLIWLLAELYAWTGDPIYKNELNYKLQKNLIPGILSDTNKDGFVDGTSPSIAFSSLSPAAQTPGRMWDGHNALPWYHAMNTWALTEAYVAFRDRGDVSRANELKPYVLAMLDNLANEITKYGTISPDALGVRDITYALLIGIWKISQFENESHLNWEQAAWAMWNTAYFNKYSTHSVCVGLYLCVLSSTPYVPLNLREKFVLSKDPVFNNAMGIRIYPNPSRNYITLEFSESVMDSYRFKLYDIQGRLIKSGLLKAETNRIILSELTPGLYTILISDHSGKHSTLRFICE